ncbi:glutamate racemase [Maricaulis sp.]|uniref:glutamate racemase n=1 Tax=Maricaulis sp. TaxID=1486257 RepID=UPI0026383182|nr:glutamate racemase [Maricaulis sp.]
MTDSPVSSPVLVFDSGLGGLSVAAEIRQRRPDLPLRYLADNAAFPYGLKADAFLKQRVIDVISAAVDRERPRLVVLACNTASTIALNELREALELPVVGTVPGIKPAAEQSRSGVIGVLATPRTAQSGYIDALVRDHGAGRHFIVQPAEGLAREAEAVLAGAAPDLDLLRGLQHAIRQAPRGEEVDTLVLGCTHYPLLQAELEATAPHAWSYLDTGSAIARRVDDLLPERGQAAAGDSALLTAGVEAEAGYARALARFGFALAEPLHRLA